MLFWRGLSALKFLFWNPITVLKWLKALSQSSMSSSDHLNLVFDSVLAAARCSLVLLAVSFLIKIFCIRTLFCFLSIYECASSSMNRVERLPETSWLVVEKLAFSWPHVIVKQFQQIFGKDNSLLGKVFPNISQNLFLRPPNFFLWNFLP